LATVSAEENGRGRLERLKTARLHRGALVQRLVHRRTAVQAVIDAGAWIVALALATLLRFDFNLELINVAGVAMMVPIAIEAQFLAGYALGLYPAASTRSRPW